MPQKSEKIDTIPQDRPDSLPIPADAPDLSSIDDQEVVPAAVDSASRSQEDIKVKVAAHDVANLHNAAVLPPPVTSQYKYPYRPQPDFIPTPRS